MPTPNSAALDFLQTRRSRPSKTLTAPVPNRDELAPLLTAAARTPDHGKLEPWRFIVLEGAAMARLADAVTQLGGALNIAPDKIEKNAKQFTDGNLAVVVVACPVENEKVPHLEQLYSAGAVCLSLLNAALASGWGANWLSGWASHEREFCETHLGLAPHEMIAGIIHIGTETSAPPERPRPDLARITQWMST